MFEMNFLNKKHEKTNQIKMLRTVASMGLRNARACIHEHFSCLQFFVADFFVVICLELVCDTLFGGSD